MIINGKAVSSAILDNLKLALKESSIQPRLDIILASDDEASYKYVDLKKRVGEDVGFAVNIHNFDRSVSTDDIVAKVRELNNAPDVHGVMVQLPMFDHIDQFVVLSAIDITKDVDGLSPHTLGRLFHGAGDAFISATALGIVNLMEAYDIDVAGKHVVMVGWNSFIGMPLESILVKNGATFTVCHKRTTNLSAFTQSADILISAVGKEGLITADMVKDGSVVFDVGFNKTADGSFVGDVDFDSVKDKAALITPVPGGVGPMTIASLFLNLALASGII